MRYRVAWMLTAVFMGVFMSGHMISMAQAATPRASTVPKTKKVVMQKKKPVKKFSPKSVRAPVRSPTMPRAKVAPRIAVPVIPRKPAVPAAPKKDSRSATVPAVSAERVMINGVVLTEAQLAAFESQYGVRPRQGRYWYDAKSGLYGNEGSGSSGFLLPGHALGTLAANVSHGATGVFFNGRELVTSEVAIIDRIIGMASPPGRYWFDAAGNVGLEGTDIPLVNLAIASSANGQSGGDSFWSTRFSAGNSNASNSQGYVSVPGYGPVGYGF